MGVSMRWMAGVAMLGMIVAAPSLGRAQHGGLSGLDATQQTPGPVNHPPRLGDGAGELSAPMQERLGIARMNERQKLLVADTDKLVELALALKKDVDKTDKNMLSLDVVKRAEAIEKLARSVKEREKGQK